MSLREVRRVNEGFPKMEQEWNEARLQGLVDDGATESLQLEFKACGALSKNPDGKAEVGKDVSAMANAAGGTIIYGIIEKGRVAHAIDLGFEPHTFSREWLEQVIASNVQPRIEGLEIAVVPLISSGTVAYVVNVPQAISRAPHQAADGRYYKRANFVNQIMEDYEVRDALRRISIASLRIEAPRHISGGNVGVNIHRHTLCFSVRNTSNLTAKFPHVQIKSLVGGRVDEYGINGNGYFPLARQLPLQSLAFSGDASTVIHPDQSLEVFHLIFDVKVPGNDISYTGQQWPTGFIPFDGAVLELDIATSCENAPQSRQMLRWTGQQLLQLFGYGVPTAA